MTISQLINHGRTKKFKKINYLAYGRPQMSGRVKISKKQKPKKPNSANRAIAVLSTKFKMPHQLKNKISSQFKPKYTHYYKPLTYNNKFAKTSKSNKVNQIRQVNKAISIPYEAAKVLVHFTLYAYARNRKDLNSVIYCATRGRGDLGGVQTCVNKGSKKGLKKVKRDENKVKYKLEYTNKKKKDKENKKKK